MNELEFHVRASSVAGFFDCPASWAARNIDGLRLPTSAPAIIGTAVHASTAVFDHGVHNKSPVSPDDAAGVLVDTLHHPPEDVDWGGMRLSTAIERGLGVHTRYCCEIAPLQTYHSIEHTLDDLRVEIEVDDTLVTLVLTGTLDRIREVAGKYGIADVKTGQRACSAATGRHKAQLGMYELLAEQSMGLTMDLPGQIIALQTSSNYQAELKEVPNARAVLVGNASMTGMLTHMARMLKSGDFYGNPMSWLCSEKFCPAWTDCVFR